MIKWFFIYKWIEFKEWIDEYMGAIIMVFAILAPMCIASIIFKFMGNKSWLGDGIVNGMIFDVAVGIIIVLFVWLRDLIKDNIEKARSAVEVEKKLGNYKCRDCESTPIIKNSYPPRMICPNCGSWDITSI